MEPEKMHPTWTAPRRRAAILAGLESVLERGDLATTLAGFAPSQPGYSRLREALARYRGLAEQGGWPMVGEGPPLKLGVKGARVEALRRRLATVGDLPRTAAMGSLFDPPLQKAVKVFQRCHGLPETGEVHAATLASLDVPVESRVEQLEANMERWRWLPDDLGRRHLLVNIAAFKLTLWEGERTVLDMRAIVGQQFRKTPVFSDSLRFLVINPTWTVPRYIATEDLLPQICRDRLFLSKGGFTVYQTKGRREHEVDPRSVDWSEVSSKQFPYVLKQAPGPLNPLGRVKFMFPNKHAIYLHDTPRRELFRRTERSFSSGCVRIEDPLDLATELLRDDPRWPRGALEEAVRSGREQKIPLREPVPIHLLYWTSWVDRDGMVSFRPDIYDRDRFLITALR